ncbi:GtrA family protein [Micromonospora sp. NPDC049559]|uniref:GtrA family protein n=1 Tax=Micromonospora sp. NPDC049559 TaxID=3155923 RepID=UPI003424EE96
MTAAADGTVAEPGSPTAVPAGGGLVAAVRRLLGSGFVRFLLVGGLSAAVDTGLLWLLHGGFGVPVPVATLVGVVTSFVVNFLLNRGWVFAATGSTRGQLVRYLLLAALNWVLTVLSVSALVAVGVYYLVARLAVLVVLTVLNFVGYRVWVFRTPR